MKAVSYDTYGSPEVFRIENIPKPIPSGKDVLVKVHATSINSYDWDMLRGKPWYIKAINGWKKPKIQVLGCDFAGVIESVGSEITKFKIGDRVFGDVSPAKWGGFGEYLIAPEKLISKMPESMSFEDASALPQAGVLAIQALDMVPKAKSILLIGAGGGIGSFLIPIARKEGRIVTGVDKDSKEEFIKSLGAQDFIAHKIHPRDWVGKYDAIIDVVGKNPSKDFVHLLKKSGIYVMVGGTPGNLFKTLGRVLFTNHFSGKKFKILGHKPNSEDLKRLLELYRKGDFKIQIDRVFPFSQTPEAMEYFGEGNFKGKIVISHNS